MNEAKGEGDENAEPGGLPRAMEERKVAEAKDP
jgi:hypothetical protein